MDKFWELLQQSVIVQAMVTLMLIGTLCYLWIVGATVPGELLGFTGAVLGFWFGTKVQQIANTQAKRLH